MTHHGSVRVPLPHATAKKPGFTLTEIALALLLLGLIASFTIPTLLTLSSGTQRQQLSKNMFTVIGEAHLARRSATDQFPLSWDTNEQKQFALYLKSHLNYVNVMANIEAVNASDFCHATPAAFNPASDPIFFSMANGIQVFSFCYVGTTTPPTLQVSFSVPKVDGTPSVFQVYLPEIQDRYTTKYGFTGTAGDCVALDRWVGTCGEADNPCPGACPNI